VKRYASMEKKSKAQKGTNKNANRNYRTFQKVLTKTYKAKDQMKVESEQKKLAKGSMVKVTEMRTKFSAKSRPRPRQKGQEHPEVPEIKRCTSWSHGGSCLSFSVRSAFFMLVGCFFFAVGYRFYRPCLFLGGFSFASTVVFAASYSISEILAYFLAVVLGTLFGIITLYLYPLGVFILGVNWGVTLALLSYGLVFHTWGAHMVASSFILWILLIVCALVVGVVTILVHRHNESSSGYSCSKMVIFSKTSWVGAYMFIRGVGAAFGGYPFELKMGQMHHSMPSSYYTYAGLTVALAVLATCFQLYFTHWDHCGCPDRGTTEEEDTLISGAAAKGVPAESNVLN